MVDYSSSVNYFRYGYYVLVGLEVGVEEPVSWHKKYEIVSVVNDYTGVICYDKLALIG